MVLPNGLFRLTIELPLPPPLRVHDLSHHRSSSTFLQNTGRLYATPGRSRNALYSWTRLGRDFSWPDAIGRGVCVGPPFDGPYEATGQSPERYGDEIRQERFALRNSSMQKEWCDKWALVTGASA